MTDQTWIVDLDNTLYRADTNLFDQIDVRMGRFIADMFNVDRVEARRIQKEYFVKYGTTLSGLIACHDMAPHDFLEYVHDIDVSDVPRIPGLKDALEALPGRRIIYTNGSFTHAERLLSHLGVADAFDGIFDIAAADFAAKPSMDAMQACVDRYKIVPDEATMFDDMAVNLKPAAQLGMHTVWIDTGSPYGRSGVGAHVKEEVPDLMTWLTRQVQTLEAGKT